MPNLYGVANAPGGIVLAYAPSDAVITHDVNTAVITSAPLIAPSRGFFYAMIWGALQVTMGATAATGINQMCQIGAGSWQNSFGNTALYAAANGTYLVPVATWTSPSEVAWQGAGSTVSLGIVAGANNLTVRQYSWALFALFRAPDQ